MSESVAQLLTSAVQRHQAGDLVGAREGYTEVLRRNPRQADALHLLGVLQDQQGAHEQAVDLISRAIAINPAEAGFHGNLGTALLALQRVAEAEAAYRRSIALDPEYVDGHYNLGNLLRSRGETAEARRHLEVALSLQPDHLQARNNLAMLLWEDMGDTAAAEQQFRLLLEAAPAWATARMNYGVFRLGQGDYAAGWREYEWRWQSEAYPERDWGMGLPRWDGRTLGGAGLLVWGEQGVGDQILYGTMLAELQRRCAGRLIIAVDPRLVRLFSRSLEPLGAAVVPRGASVQAAMQVPFGSLGTLLRQSAEDFTGSGAYLQADPHVRQDLASAYRELAGQGRRLIGLSWRSHNKTIGPSKSIPLPKLLQILKRYPEVQWINLQYGDVTEDLATLRAHGIAIHNDPAVDSLADMDGFAAQIAALDSVLTVSNTTVHVAGALGVPTLLLLPRGRGRLWYWPGQGKESRWYGAVSIVRQSSPDNWEGMLNVRIQSH